MKKMFDTNGCQRQIDTGAGGISVQMDLWGQVGAYGAKLAFCYIAIGLCLFPFF